MSTRFSQIGFSQRIRMEWLERTANLVLAGNDEPTIVAALQDHLKDQLSVGGSAERGNREKAITILLRVWVRGPQELEPLRQSGLELLSHLPKHDHLALHWGMSMATYPFWGAVATQVGRLLALQGSATAAHVQRRMREQYGERETVSRATRRVLRAFADWRALRETGTQGIYVGAPPLAVRDHRLGWWLVEALLHSRPSGSAPIREAVRGHALFPFRLDASSANGVPPSSGGLRTLRHGLDDDLLILSQRDDSGATDRD